MQEIDYFWIIIKSLRLLLQQLALLVSLCGKKINIDIILRFEPGK